MRRVWTTDLARSAAPIADDPEMRALPTGTEGAMSPRTVGLIAITAAIGYFVGRIIREIWNALHRAEQPA